MIDIDLETVDIKALLEDEEIEYSESGKNISSGSWIGISCPFCHDSSNHCGINLTSGLFSCWVCSEKGSIIKLIREIKQISYGKASVLVSKYQKDDIYGRIEKDNPTQPNVGSHNQKFLIYPTHLSDFAPDIHRSYLKARRFDPDFLTKKYRLKFTTNIGDYRFRIIAPIIVDNKELSWIAGDVLKKDGRVSYIKCPLEKSILSANSCLYNIDSVKGIAILVEGITDVWRGGNGFVASMSKMITSEQILMLLQKGVKKVFVVYDADAEKESQIVASRLSGLFETEIVKLTEGDPADLSDDEISELRKLLL